MQAMIRERLEKVKALLKEKNLDGILISSFYNIFYFTNLDCFIPIERDSFLLITKKSNYIFTYQMYEEPVKKSAKNFEIKIISRQHHLKDQLKEIYKKEVIKKLGIEEDDLKVFEYRIFRKGVKTAHIDLLELRKIKEENEVKEIGKACNLGDKAYEYILGELKGGVTEKEMARKLDSFIREAADISFDTIVAFGPNTSVPHHHPTDRKLKKGDFVLLDFGVKINNYCSDMTRTITFGEPSKKQSEIYKTVKDAQERAVGYINSCEHPKGEEADKISRKVIMERGFPDYPHTLGHGIGLEVHEHRFLAPKSKEIIKEGMVFSIEPGVYIPGFGGVRIEDLFVYEKGKLRRLTRAPYQKFN